MGTCKENTIFHKKTFLSDAGWHATAIQILVGLFMLVLYIWIFGSLINLTVHFYSSIQSNWISGSEKMIITVVMILASLELIRTLQSYLEIGRVKVTFILDAALVVLIGELIGLWYQEYSIMEVMTSLGVIVVLVTLRIVTAKFSPASFE